MIKVLVAVNFFLTLILFATVHIEPVKINQQPCVCNCEVQGPEPIWVPLEHECTDCMDEVPDHE